MRNLGLLAIGVLIVLVSIFIYFSVLIVTIVLKYILVATVVVGAILLYIKLKFKKKKL